MPNMTLICSNKNCDKAVAFEINRLPTFGFELAQIANLVGWKHRIDFRHHGVFVACSDECLDKVK